MIARSQHLAGVWLLAGTLLAAATTHCGASGSRAGSEESMERLLERVDRYQSLFTREEYGEAYEMLAQKWRKSDNDKQEWLAYTSRMGRSVKITHWSVLSISTIGDRAKVSVSVQVKAGETTEPERVTEVQFWQFENGDWFHIPIQLSDWNDAEAVSIPLRK